MTDYTAHEVEAALEERLDDGGWNELAWELEGSRPVNPFVELRGEQVPMTCADDHGGNEGGGEERWVVIKVGTQFFKKPGYYASYDGSTFDGVLREVRPREISVTVYE